MATKELKESPVDVVEDLSNEGYSSEQDVDNDEVYSYKEQRAIIHRIDRRIIPVLGGMYIVALVDRVNLGTAVIVGLEKDLQLQVGYRYSTIILTFFVAYIIFQPLGTIFTRKLGPKWFLCTITLAWGIVMIGNGFVHSWQQLAGLRVLTGAFEAGYFPGAAYLLSTWYSRYDMQKRYTAFYGIGCITTGFAGILNYGVSQMNGLRGLAGWRWIFIIDGVISCLIALVSYLFVVDFPEEAHKTRRFISNDERDFIIRRVNRDRADAITEPFSLGAFLRSAQDPKIWVFAFMFFCISMVGYSINYFLPTILLSMGFNVSQAQCLVAPPWVFSVMLMMVEAWFGDKYHLRGPIIVLNVVLSLIGLSLMGFVEKSSARYFGVFLVLAGASGNAPPILAYQANNIRGHWKRAFSSATLVGSGGIGGIAGALVFRSQDAPKYLPGIYAAIASNCCILLCVAGLTTWFWYCNRRAKQGLVVLEGLKGFYYTY